MKLGLFLLVISLCLVWLLTPSSWASEEGSITLPLQLEPSAEQEKSNTKPRRWWENRKNRPDIYYPHKPHLKVMKQGGDACLLCHPYSKTTITDPKQLEPLNVIANEPLEAICHSCHVDKLTAPSRCELCHNEPTAIWSDDHNFDYLNHHGEDSRLDDGECRQCHIDLSFCADCHFRRDSSQRRAHGLGYRSSHGIDARISAASCSRCHNSRYCRDCHQEIR